MVENNDGLLLLLPVLGLGLGFMNWLAWKAWHDPDAFEWAVHLNAARLGYRAARGLARGQAVLAAYFDSILTDLRQDALRPRQRAAGVCALPPVPKGQQRRRIPGRRRPNRD